MLSHRIFIMLRRACKSVSLYTTTARGVSDKSNIDTNNSSPRTEKSINLVTLLGRVGAEPQKRGNEQHPVVLFSLATQSNFKYDSGEVNQKTEWHRICVFKPTLRDTVYNYLRKGQRVHVTGKLSYGEVKDEHGNTKQMASIIADDVIFFQSYD